MADTSHQTTIDNYLDKYILKKEIPQDSYFALLQHACDCFRTINIRHSNRVVTEKVTASSLGIIEMPSDMIGFGFLAVPINGEWWTFTKKGRKVNTTTTTSGVEGQNSDFGEGVDVYDDEYLGLNGRGGVNAYYVNVDWKARRLFCDGFKSDTAVLRYTSSGLVIGGTTYIPVQCETVMDAYLDWKRAENREDSLSRIMYHKDKYDNEILALRIVNFMPSLDEIKDAWDSSSSMAIQR